MVRSRKLVLTNWTLANNALMQHFEGNKSKLAMHVRMSRTTVTNFFSEIPISESNFRKISLALHLNWQKIASVDANTETTSHTASLSYQLDKTLIQKVREHCRQKILQQHSRMRLLSGREIGVDQLYVDVYLLDNPESRHFNSPKSLLKEFDIAKDRLALSKRISRNPGFKVANQKKKLVILGKPGSGKTTFIKHLSVDWCNGKFQTDLIVILIELRKIRDEKWNLLKNIDSELGLRNLHNLLSIEAKIKDLKLLEKQRLDEKAGQQLLKLNQQLDALPLQYLLKQGKLLVLMDGLDEVPTLLIRNNVKEQLLNVSEKYSNNRFILTCRTQIMGDSLLGFSSVEIAEFNPDQVKKFVQNWFKALSYDSSKVKERWKKFDETLADSPDIRELTFTPVLLSLICLVFQDEGEIPSDRVWLYKKGIKLLLSKWNDNKQIGGWELGAETYRKLQVAAKEELLIKIAARKFENPENFILFGQEELARQISKQLNLTSLEEGVAVLKAIETQHGLLVERADELWSFSHFTFQEHFTIQWLTQLSSQKLLEKILDQQWQAVVKQLVKSQQPADRLLQLIKQAIDQSIARESEIQTLLTWLLRKSQAIQADYKSEAIRAFYYALHFVLDRPLIDRRVGIPDRARTRAQVLKFALKLDLNFVRDQDLALDRARTLALDLELTRTLILAVLSLENPITSSLDLSLYRACEHVRALQRARHLELDFDLRRDLALDLDPNVVVQRAQERSLEFDSDLPDQLQKLRVSLPEWTNQKREKQWWKIHGLQWVQQLRQAMIEHRNIGHDRQFTDAQIQQLKRYYEANQFLIDLLHIEGAASDKIRIEIEDTLLLPWEELQHR